MSSIGGVRKPSKKPPKDRRPEMEAAQIKTMIEAMLDEHARFVYVVPAAMFDAIVERVFNTKVEEDLRDRSLNRARMEIRMGDGLMWFDVETNDRRTAWNNAVSRRATVMISPYCRDDVADWPNGPVTETENV